jgi:cell division protein FtsX
MKLVGAANWFIRSPYLVSGVIYGFFAVLLSVIITYPLIGFIEPYLAGLFSGANLDLLKFFTDNYFYIFGGQFLGVVILTTIASSLAVGRYLKI